jgi:hypothetical protein
MDFVALCKLAIRLVLAVLVVGAMVVLLTVVSSGVAAALVGWCTVSGVDVFGSGAFMASSPAYLFATGIGWYMGTGWIVVGAALMATVGVMGIVALVRVIGLVVDGLG